MANSKIVEIDKYYPSLAVKRFNFHRPKGSFLQSRDLKLELIIF
jgi:hypothetical protein